VTADDELKVMGARYPVVEQFRQLKKTVGALRMNKYAAGPDGRSHTSLHPFGTKTGRNAPKGSLSIWMGPAWMRAFMRAGPGRAKIYLDYVAQEFAIRMAQSGDQAGIGAYLSPYMQTGILVGLAPAGATKHTHPDERALCKVLVLALSYGMTPWGLGRRLGIEESEAAELVAKYDAVYPVAKAWSEGMAAHARAYGRITTPFGWEMHVSRSTNARTLLNWPIQSLAADLLRLVSIALVGEGLTVCSLIHDAVLLECRIDEIDHVVARAIAIMVRASEQVVGIPLRVDAGSADEPHVFPYPARFHDKREGDMFDRALRLLEELEHEHQAQKLVLLSKAFGEVG
jgi:DNA polymerase I-like protein with 3'-5' exonuclease and polymerase domains